MPKRKFTDQQEIEIAEIYKSGVSARELARKYNTYHSTIKNVLRRTNTIPRNDDERNRKYKIESKTFDVIDTEAKAYWWGFMYADGSTHKRSLMISLKASDGYHLEKFKQFLESEHPIKHSENTCNGKKYKRASYFATDRYLVSRLMEIGIVSGRGKFDISELPKHLYSHWIRGLFDGDGSIGTVRNYPSIKMCGEHDVMKFVEKTVRPHVSKYALKEKRKISKHKTANVYYLYYHGINICRPVYEYLYNNATIFLERKYKRFRKYY